MPAVLSCRLCGRVNPPEAAYCHHDGAVLSQASVRRPAEVGDWPFAQPFVFPSGRACRSMNELALACHDLWDEAKRLLRDGDLAGFLAVAGRADLARAARSAAAVPSADMGLDEFLAALPATTVLPPDLRVEPAEVSLGAMRPGQDRTFSLRLVNKGMRLVCGSVASVDTAWLAVGAAGRSDQLVQFRDEQVLSVRVVGRALMAKSKPQQGLLLVTTPTQSLSIAVQVEVAVTPFPGGVLAGARTPRELAQHCVPNPKEAARVFESGEVHRWYQANGWPYPVTIPTASGLAALQQYLEALGLAKPPEVELSETTVHVFAAAGSSVDYALEVRSGEKKPVYAHATCNQPWVRVLPAELAGRVARLRIHIPSIPEGRPLLEARLDVVANGNKRWSVPLTVQVTPPLQGRGQTAGTVAVPVAPAVRLSLPAEQVIDIVKAAPTPPPRHEPPLPRPLDEPAAVEEAFGWRPLAPVAVLVLILFGLGVRDCFAPSRAGAPREEPAAEVVEESIAIDPTPRIAIQFHEEFRNFLLDLPLGPPTMRFGITTQEGKRLTFDTVGRTNNTCVRVDDNDRLFGAAGHGKWVSRKEAAWQEEGAERRGMRSTWIANGSNVQVTQTVEVVPGQPVRDPQGKLVRYHDTCLVRYLLENRGERSHQVGLRFLLDTYIGDNDGVPFLIPGMQTGCDTMHVFQGPQVPDSVLALEKNDLAAPGTVARVQLRLGPAIEAPAMVTLGCWPHPVLNTMVQLGDGVPLGALTPWQVPVLPMKAATNVRTPLGGLFGPDSAVVAYWPPQALDPGKRRLVGFAYGLGRIAGSEAGGKLAVLCDGLAYPDKVFTVQAVASDLPEGQKLTLQLPAGLSLAEGEATVLAPAPPAGASRRQSTVTWRVRGPRVGSYRLTVRTDGGVAQSRTVVLRKPEARDIWER